MRWCLLFLVTTAAWGQSCPPVDAQAMRKQEAECRAAGGAWARYGVHAHLCGIYSCAPRTRDGGKPCHGRGDCEYQCVSKKELPLGAAVTGECAAVASPYGCSYVVQGGRIAGRICVD